MNIFTKRLIVTALAVVMLVMSIAVPFEKAEAAMTYNNTMSANLYCNIESNGHLCANMDVTGYKNRTTSIHVELYVEKRVLGIFWSRVEIGYTNNTWIDSTTSYIYSGVFDTALPSTGTYRTTVTYTITGTGGSDDVIVKTDTVTY